MRAMGRFPCGYRAVRIWKTSEQIPTHQQLLSSQVNAGDVARDRHLRSLDRPNVHVIGVREHDLGLGSLHDFAETLRSFAEDDRVVLRGDLKMHLHWDLKSNVLVGGKSQKSFGGFVCLRGRGEDFPGIQHESIASLTSNMNSISRLVASITFLCSFSHPLTRIIDECSFGRVLKIT
jgi:hypothetical protein